LTASCVNVDKHWTDWDGGGRDNLSWSSETPPGLISISITPADSVVTQDLNKQKQVSFKVTGQYPSGPKDVTPLSYFRLLDGTLGSFSGATLTTTANMAGLTSVEAVVGSLTAKTKLTVKVNANIVVDGAPKDAASSFASPCTGAAPITVVYPEAGAMMPPNLADFSVMWTDAASDLWELTLQSALTEMKIYTAKKKHRLSDTIWNAIASSSLGGVMKLSVRGVSKASSAKCAASKEMEVHIGPAKLKGGVYYWITKPASAIMRYDLSKSSTKPESYVTKATTGKCVGCHAVSPDGTRLAFSDEFDDGGILNVETGKLLPPKNPAKVTFQAFTPDNKYLVSSTQGKLSIRDGSTGAHVVSLALGKATLPEISPAGDMIVFVRPLWTASGSNINGGTIVTVSLTGTKIGTPKVLVLGAEKENNYYPTFSPDGKWVLFNRSSAGSYSEDTAQLWLVNASGGTPMQLTRANQGKKLRNSWPRWFPFTHSYKGRKLFWFSFSSIRDYGTDLVNSTKTSANAIPQIWMTAFDVSLAEAGKDPSYPAFWLPFQHLGSRNHIAQWTKKVPQVK